MRRPHLIGLATAALLAAAASLSPANAGSHRPLGVVELFTSQGCNSCPPADEALGDFAASGDLVALAYHVDYWDYLGWRDTMASPENTARQRAYGRSFGEGAVYTPQAVINGRTHMNGARQASIEDTIGAFAASGKGLDVAVDFERAGDSLVIETGAAAGEAREAHVVLVYFDPAKDVVIKRGENRGRTITYWNAVTGFQTVGMWHGEAQRIELPLSEVDKKSGAGCAVLLQAVSHDGLPGPILGAAVMTKPGA